MKRKPKIIEIANQMMFDFDSIEEELISNGNIIEEDLFLSGNIQNIRNMLPKLYDHQHEDVAKAEERFATGKGYLFTNGTGTGKTFVGLGIAKRFYVQDKKNIIIVVPTEKKATDWVEDGEIIDLPIYMIKGIHEAGHNVIVTTYANFYQNNALNRRTWDLIIYDESHYLGQNQQGSQTTYYQQHRQLSNVPSAARTKVEKLMENEKPKYDGTSSYFQLNREYEEKSQKKVNELVSATKVVFLSATPFAYHKSIKYADGCLFDIDEQLQLKQNNGVGYNEAVGYDQFLIENFGYRMRCNKVSIPESGVDVNLMERNFFENMKDKGVMSTRILNLKHDYSRHFITVDSTIGDLINTGMELFYIDNFEKRYPILYKTKNIKYNYLYVNQLLESIKAKEVHHRIEQHLKLNRKVVIFHSYNHAAVRHPFQFDAYELLSEKDMFMLPKLQQEISKFRKEYSEYWNMDLSGLKNTRDAILEHFPNAKQFNGTIPKKARSGFINDFNNDKSEVDILLVQIKAGREGISLHDKKGGKQRILMNLGLPTAPTEAIQSEGRIYREGLKSNAVYEYITLQTNFERIAFGTKIAERSRTAENLAMGNLARDLETSFKEGYVASDYMPPSLEQGVGGKSADKFSNDMTEFDKAITYYYARGKRNAKQKSKEGIDYFATPEPLGYKMVQWLNPQPDENGMEPSSGHGAISRWFPGNTNNHFIEPSINLVGELAINSSGTVKMARFEEHSSINKYEFIAMNPPFGVSGKTAMEHLHKALTRHNARHGARLIAIVPGGPSMDSRVQQFMESKEAEHICLRHQIRLPQCTFERAGTSVACKILYFQHDPYYGYKKPETNKIDLSYIKDIKEFFEVLRDLEL